MKTRGVIVCLALAVIQVLAEEPLAFVEDVTRLSGARIVSGWEAEEGQIPWQLSLRMVNPTGAVSSCGGSIIHPLWGMTAAHCTATRVTMVLRAGAVSLTRPELLFETTEYFNHPLYIDQLVSIVQPNDIALLKFPREISFSDRVQPIRLQRDEDRNRNYAGVRLEASGWGRTWTNGAAPENLQWVYLTGDSNLACWLAFGGSSIIQDSTICASAYNVSSQSTCQGDSGGPLVELEEDGKYTMVGVTSFVSGAGCHADFPAGFIRPGHYHQWIREVTGLNFDWDYEEPTTVAPTTEAATTEADSSSSSSSSESSSSESSSEESEVTTTEAPTTETTTTEADSSSSSSSSESSSNESSSEESEVTTTEAPTTETTTTEAATTEADSSSSSSSSESSSNESSSEESEVTTTEAPTTETTTTEAATTEAATTEAATTEADNSSSSSSSESSSGESSSEESEVTTTVAPTTEATTTEAATTEADSSSSSSSSESSSNESSSEESEVTTTVAPTTEATTTEAATTEADSSSSSSSSESSSNESSSEDSEVTTTEAEVDAPEESRSVFSYFRNSFARFY